LSKLLYITELKVIDYSVKVNVKFLNQYAGVGPGGQLEPVHCYAQRWPLVAVMGGRPASFFGLPFVFVDGLQLQAAHCLKFQRLSRHIAVRFFFEI